MVMMGGKASLTLKFKRGTLEDLMQFVMIGQEIGGFNPNSRSKLPILQDLGHTA